MTITSISLTIGVVLVAIGTTTQAQAADPVIDEYRIKGAFLLNFAKFVDWPAQAFKTPDAPIVICVLGQSPFGEELEKAARATLVDKRPLIIRQVTDSRQPHECHIVFVSSAERKRARMLLEAVQGGNVLTVGETEGFVSSGGVMAFRLEGEKIRIAISTTAADRAGLHISAKLLSLAQAEKSQAGTR